MAPVDFSGKWKLEKAENQDDYLKEIGVGWMMRKAAGAMIGSVSQSIKQDGDHFEIIVTNPKGDFTETFNIGEEFESELKPNNDKAKCIAKWEGNTLVLDCTPVDPSKKAQHLVRELLNENEMLITITVGQVVCKRYFARK